MGLTIVIADTDGETVVFAADSAAASGNEIYTLETEKVFKRDGYLFGYCASYRIGQILRHCVQLPEYPEEATDMEGFMVRALVPAIRKAVETEGAVGSGRGFLGDKTCILTCIRGQIWNIGPDLAVIRESPFAAIGSGRLRAYAALHALRAAGIKPVQRRIKLALEATAEFTSDVRPPWLVVTMGMHGTVGS